MASTYLTLVNRLRTRFNEPELSDSNWSTVVGFDKLTKDAINYTIRDICNEESEWPFVVRVDQRVSTIPGTRLYTLSATAATGKTTNLRKVDYGSFYVEHNAKFLPEFSGSGGFAGNIPATSPYEVDVGDTEWSGDVGVEFNGAIVGTRNNRDPSANEYAIKSPGVYVFNSFNASDTVIIEYEKYIPASQQAPYIRTPVKVIEYDYWRQFLMNVDYNLPTALSMPKYVYRTQSPYIVGLSPIPDKAYDVYFDCWVSPSELSATTDLHLIPDTFEDVILDGASAYCYGFREDQPLVKEYKEKYMTGVRRMRIELINPDDQMRSGFNVSGRII